MVFGDLYLPGLDMAYMFAGLAWNQMDIFRYIWPVGSPPLKKKGRAGVRTFKGCAVCGSPSLESGLPSHAKVEVAHRSDHSIKGFKGLKRPPGDSGTWFYLAPGSGIYFDLGRTIAFQDHDDAGRKFRCGCGAQHQPSCRPGVKYAECWSKQAAAQGYDTVQFTARHRENVWKYEILDTHVQKQKGGCPADDNPRFTSGWDGVRPCHCDHSSDKLNCGFFLEL